MKRAIFLLILSFFIIDGFSQSTKNTKSATTAILLKGKVIDAITNEELIGVNIFVDGDKMKGTVTDFEGNYELEVAKGETVVYRYLGYEEQSFVIDNQTTIDVSLKEEALQLNTVVISASRRKEKMLDAPASISTIDTKEIESKATTDISGHLKDIAGVHMMQTGLQGANPSIRGFNGFFTTDVLTLTDYRVAKLPNTGLSQYQMLAQSDDDIEKIEVLRGPASALYGPSANNGVIHIITKSPIDEQKTKFGITIGARQKIKDTLLMKDPNSPRFDESSLLKRGIYGASFYHADTIMNKKPNLDIGYKVSAKYFRALDWKYDDLGDPSTIIKFRASSDSVYYLLADGSIDQNGKGTEVTNERDEQINNGSVDARMDFRFKQDFNFVLNGGFSKTHGIIASPVGALQNEGWNYYYAQARFSWKDFFIQTYMNGNNSGDSYFVPAGGMYIDKSKMYALQIQNSSTIIKRINLSYGFDAFWNRPNTDGTINGENEDKDNLDEYGIYFQGDYQLHPRLTLVAGSRLDYNTVNKKVLFSPKLALSYKPGTGHNFRFTFNRAYKTPGIAGYFVDAKQAEIPQDIEVRNVGTPRNGFHYSFANNPYYDNQLLPQFKSPYGTTADAYYNVNDGSINNLAWNGVLGAIKEQFLVQFGFDPNSPLGGLADLLIGALAPGTIPDSIRHVVKNLNTTTRNFEDNTTWQNTKDIQGLKPSLTYSYEIGYKGVIAKMLGLSVDVYRTDFKNYIAPVTLTTPTVQFDAAQLLAVVAPEIAANYNDPNNEGIKTALDALLDNNEDLGGNGNGTGEDELLNLFQDALNALPIGVITPMETNGADMLLVTRNIGDVTLYGLDVGAKLYLSKSISLSANYSWMSKDSIPIKDDAVFTYVAMNAPKHKFNVGMNYYIEKIGLNLNAQFQWNAGFPVNSGNFIGHQNPTHDMDINISYTPKFWNDHFNATVSVQNVYSRKQQKFVGVPVMGTTGILKLSYTM